MITSLGIENFRRFKGQVWFDLAPITIFVGPNNSGKSSILKALMLLSESRKRNGLDYLDFSGGVHQLRSHQASVNHHSEDSHIHFGFGIHAPYVETEAFNDPDHIFGWGTREKKTILPHAGGGSSDQGRPPTDLQVVLSFDDSQYGGVHKAVIKVARDGETTLLASVTGWCDKEDEEALPEGGVKYVLGKDDSLSSSSNYALIQINGPLLKQLVLNSEVDQEEKRVVSEGSMGQILDQTLYFWSDVQSGLTFQQLTSLLSKSAHFTDPPENQVASRTFEHLKRQYGIEWSVGEHSNEKTPGDHLFELLKPFFEATFGAVGRNLRRDKMLYLEEMQIGSNPIYVEGSTPPALMRLLRYASRRSTTFGQDKRWLSEFGLGSDIKVEPVEGVGYVVRVKNDGGWRSISDLGDGASQMMPLILYLMYGESMDNGRRSDRGLDFLLMSEPEARLHPNFQAKLADLLVSISKGEKREGSNCTRPYKGTPPRLLVETHSEYLIRRLQLLAARGEVPHEDILIYYLGAEPGDGDNIRRITVDPYGQLSEPFGPGFFDEATNLMMDLFKYGQKN